MPTQALLFGPFCGRVWPIATNYAEVSSHVRFTQRDQSSKNQLAETRKPTPNIKSVKSVT